MEQSKFLMQMLTELRQQLNTLQNTIDTLREQSRQKDEEIERLRQIILNLQRAQFGQRSEKRTYVLDDGNQQLSLFDMQTETEETPAPEPLQNPERLRLTITFLGVRRKDSQPSSCCSVRFEQVEPPDAGEFASRNRLNRQREKMDSDCRFFVLEKCE